jgi:phosphatidylinositol alpha 1,6-mannosyltransferase
MLKKISIITSVFLPEEGGSPIAVFNRCISFVRMGLKVQLFIPDYGSKSDPNLLATFKDLGIELILLPTKKSNWVPLKLVPSSKSKKIIYNELFNFRPEIVIVDEPVGLKLMSSISLDLKRLQKAGIFTCAIAHANAMGVLKKLKKHLLAIIIRWVSKRVYSKFNLTLCSSNYLFDTFSFLKNTQVVNHLGVNKEIFKVVDRHEKENLNVLYFGRVAPEKNIKFLFDAALKSIDKYSNLTWTFVGDGPELEYWKGKLMNRIHFVGAKHDIDLFNYIINADIFVTACDIEAFGLTIVEAMSTGLPVLVPDKGAASKHFIEGESGMSYKTSNSDNFLEKLDILINDNRKRKEIGRKASKIPLDWTEASEKVIQSCTEKASHDKGKFIINSQIVKKAPNNQLDLSISSIMTEYTEIIGIIKDYQKNTLQNLYITIVLLGVAIGLGSSGSPWVYPIMQVVLIIFFFIGYKLEQDTIGDSAYAVHIENKVNTLLGLNLINWQRTVGVVPHNNGYRKQSFEYQLGGIIIGIFYFAFYAIVCYLYSKSIADDTVKDTYIILSIFVFVLIFVIFMIGRKKTIDEVILKMFKDESIFLNQLKNQD